MPRPTAMPRIANAQPAKVVQRDTRSAPPGDVPDSALDGVGVAVPVSTAGVVIGIRISGVVASNDRPGSRQDRDHTILDDPAHLFQSPFGSGGSSGRGV